MVAITADVNELTVLGRDLGVARGRVGATVSKIHRKTTHDIEADSKVGAPVDTGTLQGSISSTITGSGLAGVMVSEIGPTVEYGDFVERGTSRQDPQPYMAPAFDRRVPLMEVALAAAATQGLE